MPIGHYEFEGEYFERMRKRRKQSLREGGSKMDWRERAEQYDMSASGQDPNTVRYKEAVAEAYERMERLEETPTDAIRFLVDSRGVDSETARKAVEEAGRSLRQGRGY